MDVHARIAANRRSLADFFDSLDDDQLATQSLCEAWTVRDVLGHLVMPLTTGAGAFVLEVVRARGSVDRAVARLGQKVGRQPVPELTAALREHAEVRIKAPGVGPMGQFADGCLHLRDCARPLGLPDTVGLDDWRLLLEWLTAGVPGLVPRRRVRGLRFTATDQDWSTGSGTEVAGPSEALALAVAGRTVAYDDLSGEGVPHLRDHG